MISEDADHIRQNIAELGGLATATGLQRVLKVSRARVHVLAGEPGFPAPIPVEGGGRAWFVAEVAEWRAKRPDRRGGRCPS